MNWASLVVNLLKLAVMLVTFFRNRQMIDAGRDKAVAEAALEVLDATDYGKKLRERVRQLSDADADALWDDLINV